MISVRAVLSEGAYRQIICTGHAGFSERGTDIVCAAASVLVINTLNAIEALTDTDMRVDSDSRAGIISAEFDEGITEGAVLLLDAMMMGLKEISRQYGKKYISLLIDEINGKER